MSIDQPSADPEGLVKTYLESLVKKYLAECGEVFPEEEWWPDVVGFRARAAVLVVGRELHALKEVSMGQLLEDFKGNERYSVTNIVGYISGLVVREMKNSS